VVELQLDRRPALLTASTVAGEDELFHIVGYYDPGWSREGRADGNGRLRHLDALSLSLLPGDQKCVDLFLCEIVVIPVKTILEPPEAAFSYSAHGNRHTSLIRAYGLEVVPSNLCDSIRRLANVEREPTPAGEQPGLMSDRHVFSPSQHTH
jgi:hypothetical protein